MFKSTGLGKMFAGRMWPAGRMFVTSALDKLLHKFTKKSSAKRMGCFAMFFFANLCYNLS